MYTLAPAPTFLSDDFLLQTETARRLYHDYARQMPIIDYHCHLPPDQIAADRQFENMTQLWLHGDHYKWRAMRTHGIPEQYCTGDATDWEKFEKWAETIPYTLRNPLYHWSHLELKNPFGITDVLNPSTARAIYDPATNSYRTFRHEHCSCISMCGWCVRPMIRWIHSNTIAKWRRIGSRYNELQVQKCCLRSGPTRQWRPMIQRHLAGLHTKAGGGNEPRDSEPDALPRRT